MEEEESKGDNAKRIKKGYLIILGHTAVDEESPNSTSNLPIKTSAEELSNPTYHEDSNAHVTQNLSSSPTSSLSSSNIIKKQQQSSTKHSSLPLRKILSKLSVDESRSILGISNFKRPPSITNKIKSPHAVSHDSNATNQGTVVSALLSVTEKLSSIIFNLNDNFRQESIRNQIDNIDGSLDINSTVRKDSAVCLEESEELKDINNQLLDNLNIPSESSDVRSLSINYKIPSVYATPCQKSGNENVIDYDNEKISRCSLAKNYRPRRESSGYFSNLSTFDDDRRNSTTFEAIQGIGLLRERRRSSMKRLNISRFIEVDNERMPSTEIYRKGSAAGLEMPNIKELKEIRDDTVNQSSSTDDLSRIDNLPDLKITARKKYKTPSDKSILDRVNDMDNTTESTEEKEINEITTQLGQSTLITDNTHKIKSLQNILMPSQETFTEVQSRTTVDSRCQEGRENHKESSSPRRIMTPARSESCGFTESSSSSSSSVANSQRQRKRMIHSYSSTSSSNSELERILEKPPDTKINLINNSITKDTDDNDDVVIARRPNGNNDSEISRKILPKSIKIYQLLSTQSEDRGDGEPRLMDRRISLQITRHDDEENQLCEEIITTTPTSTPVTTTTTTTTLLPEDKKLIHCDSVPLLQVPSSNDNEDDTNNETLKVHRLSPLRKLSPPGEVCINQRLLDDNGSVGIRPIYPYCPYSPYGSPQGSPRARRRPLRESRRVSIDNRQGALQLNQYKLLDNIGQGSFGIVKLAYNEEDETHYAMKILSKKKLMKKAGIFGRMAPGKKSAANPLAKVYREIALLKKLDHPNVVKLVEVLDDPDEDNLYLVFELIQKGEVLQLPTDKPLDEETARKNFRDIVLGVEYLHYQRIVHRDIKPSNLLVDSEGNVKVADLGVSAELRASGELLSGSAGTPAFAAPETTILGAQYSGTLCDVWSMGVTLYSLVTGRVPWDGAGSIIGVQAAVRTEPLRFPEQPKLSENLRHLISRMLDKDPASRIHLQEIKTHCWLTNNGKDPLPSEMDNCRLPVTVTDEEVARVVTRVPKLDTLILIKTMLKQHSFQNPFLSKRIIKPIYDETISKRSSKNTLADCDNKLVQTTATELMKSKTEQFHRAGRSNSAPDSYDCQTNGRQISIDTSLPSVIEATVLESDLDKR
ncbi:hypothetical protein PV327_004327 [Microctonus hyperodae]|uniref:calcium/calmodulin-dependent protein kinase n=1 Tax=Microctonus hyperodae TaxID=165561 RepID=A0AA39FC55_MICHY|nr:hypothetical protein PV327_004327 [Microctonus hyperodae]